MRSVQSCSRNDVIFPQESGRAELSPAGSWSQGATGESWRAALGSFQFTHCKDAKWSQEVRKAPARGKGGSRVGRWSIQAAREQKMWDRSCTAQPEKEVRGDTNEKGL